MQQLERAIMPNRIRDYRAEYRRRIERGVAKGLSRSQARGHPKPSETNSARRAARPLEDSRLQQALTALRQEKSLAKAARAARVAPERLRRYASAAGAIEKHGRRWRVNADLPRRVLIYSRGREHRIIVGDFVSASLVGTYMSAVGRFLQTNNHAHLEPFLGVSVTDVKGKVYPLETRPNTLYRLSAARGESFEQVYRIVVNY